jgi:deazaflavin-dependent oxidoreductase (nitroreductase family)
MATMTTKTSDAVQSGVMDAVAGGAASKPAELSQADALLRQGFKYGNRLMLLMWRLGLQRWGMSNSYSGYIMVLTHTGRKSGKQRRTPVNFARMGNAVYCVAGFGAVADWYRNLLADPHAEVWLPDGSWWEGEAEDLTGLPDEQRLPLVRQVLINSGFAALAAGVNPRSMSEAELKAVTTAYKLIRIRRMGERSGPGGPSDLAWVWPPAAAVLGLLLWRRGRR